MGVKIPPVNLCGIESFRHGKPWKETRRTKVWGFAGVGGSPGVFDNFDEYFKLTMKLKTSIQERVSNSLLFLFVH